jgi:hypothetical protein
MHAILDVIEEFGTYGCTNYLYEIALIKFVKN